MAVRGLLLTEKASAAYAALTTVVAAVLWSALPEPGRVLLVRGGWLLLTAALLALGRWLLRRPGASARTRHWVEGGRALGQMAWLYFWYPDIYQFNRALPNLDHLVAQAEQWCFGLQPSLELSRWLPGTVWSELFHLGYWSYYPMIFALSAMVFWCRGRDFERVTGLTLISFFIYYMLYLLLPVAGPQFYFLAVGLDEAAAGHFPAIGHYFADHRELLPSPGDADGLFYRLVAMAQATGERPIAAFPSSHVGISTIQLLLARRHAPRLLPLLVPLWLLLLGATVYIQAHYLLDALAGLVSAPAVLWVAGKLGDAPVPDELNR